MLSGVCLSLRGGVAPIRRCQTTIGNEATDIMKDLLLAAVAATAVLGCSSVRAAEITLIAPGGIRAAIDQMTPDFEKRTGHTVKATYGSGGGTKAQVIRGEHFDVPVVQLPLEPVLASGQVIAGSETPLATVSVGIAVRIGAPKPNIATADEVKRFFSERNTSLFQMPRPAPQPG
jgi:ABC-type molybdate transport system substrate-binding protein